jgi:hypothetical protein
VRQDPRRYRAAKGSTPGQNGLRRRKGPTTALPKHLGNGYNGRKAGLPLLRPRDYRAAANGASKLPARDTLFTSFCAAQCGKRSPIQCIGESEPQSGSVCPERNIPETSGDESNEGAKGRILVCCRRLRGNEFPHSIRILAGETLDALSSD